LTIAALPRLTWPGRSRRSGILPGFGLTLGLTLGYLALIVLLPLSSLALFTAKAGADAFWQAVATPRVASAFRVSLMTAGLAATADAVLGLILSWVLVRYRFPGKRVVDALIDLPFALPTAVAGIALTTLYAPTGWIGALLEPLGIRVAFTPVGIVVALMFVGLPFVVRTIEPVLQDLEPELEEAAKSLGASRGQTFVRVVFPSILPALMAGFALALARGLGEYGSVIFIAGNLPGVSEIVPLVIVIKLQQFDNAGAAAIAVLMLAISFVLLMAINLLQRWARRRYGG
jgi:sulfate transport system permease protein